MNDLLDRIRFAPERVLIDDLFSRYDLEKLISHYEATAGPVAHEYVLGTQLRLTPILAPRLVSLLDEVCAAVGFTETTQLFVQADPSVNAMAIHSQAEGLPHMVSLTSGLVEMMSDDELRFVLGHELGHLHYRHYRAGVIHLAVGEDEEGNSRLPGLLSRKMESWERLAELSADRVGFAAVGGKVEPAITAFFKMASGLGPEHLRFDVGAFLSQLEDLQSLQRREVLAQFSHPVTPVRVRALQL
ncbi:MAG: M48 family metallopeptidase [Deltaproteobacteria bacterium]|nr:M48 family metallopeptidase [Deltaproteobacteria bacterium]